MKKDKIHNYRGSEKHHCHQQHQQQQCEGEGEGEGEAITTTMDGWMDGRVDNARFDMLLTFDAPGIEHLGGMGGGNVN